MADTVDGVIRVYIQLRERKAQLEAALKDKLTSLREDMSTLENWLLEQAEATGVKSFRTDAGTAYITTQDSATVADWDLTLRHILDTENYDLLEKRVSKTVVRGFIEDHGAPPPGVNFSSRRAINVRSPSPE